jgi:hypothetical protein
MKEKSSSSAVIRTVIIPGIAALIALAGCGVHVKVNDGKVEPTDNWYE